MTRLARDQAAPRIGRKAARIDDQYLADDDAGAPWSMKKRPPTCAPG
ncbi:MAG TPA: hypothetical protein VLA00_03090 [Xanthobacteraceae bacterium]|nr:hypothetical protein [Xanthobacteraceae bacterium]